MLLTVPTACHKFDDRCAESDRITAQSILINTVYPITSACSFYPPPPRLLASIVDLLLSAVHWLLAQFSPTDDNPDPTTRTKRARHRKSSRSSFRTFAKRFFEAKVVCSVRNFVRRSVGKHGIIDTPRGICRIFSSLAHDSISLASYAIVRLSVRHTGGSVKNGWS